MLIMTLIIVAVLLTGLFLMSTEQIHHINRATVAMFTGVVVWVVYMLYGGTFLNLMHPDDYKAFLDGATPNADTMKEFVSTHIIIRYINEACSVILFLIATNTIVEVLHNNGVFDSLVDWLRMRSSRRFLWHVSLLTFLVSANVDNLTTVVLMMSIITQIVRSHAQRIIYSCAILIAATLGGCFTVIGDMTSVMLWSRELVTPTSFAAGLFLPAFSSLCVFNLLISAKLHGRVETVSVFGRYKGDESYLHAWQKVVLLLIGIGGLWFIPTFHYITKLQPFLGALCILALMWAVEGIFNLKRNGNVLYFNRHYFRNTEFIGMRMILYFLGISLGIGALTECGALDFMGHILDSYIDNIYVYTILNGIVSSVVDNIPLMQVGMNLFPFDPVPGSEFSLNGAYWQLLSFCCSMGGALLFIGTMTGQAVLQVEKIPFSWYIRNYFWRALVAWIVGIIVFWLIH